MNKELSGALRAAIDRAPLIAPQVRKLVVEQIFAIPGGEYVLYQILKLPDRQVGKFIKGVCPPHDEYALQQLAIMFRSEHRNIFDL